MILYIQKIKIVWNYSASDVNPVSGEPFAYFSWNVCGIENFHNQIQFSEMWGVEFNMADT